MSSTIEKIKWSLILILSSVFLVWVLFRTFSSENVYVDDGPDNPQTAETANVAVDEQSTQAVEQPQEGATEAANAPDAPSEQSNNLDINIDESWGEAGRTETNGVTAYIFTHTDGSTFKVTLSSDAVAQEPADFKWSHTVTDTGGAFAVSDVVEASTTICDEGSEGCSSGNGVLEISSYNDTGDVKVYVQIADTDQNNTEASSYYQAIIESITVS